MPRNHPLLYSFRRCPYAIRARLALRYAGIACELREVVLRHKPAQLMAVSPKATVPVLVLPPPEGGVGEVIDESLDIMLWALARHDPDGWLNVDPELADELIKANDDEFKLWLDRYKYPGRDAAATGVDARRECERFIGDLEVRLKAHAYVAGEKLSFADMALFPFVRQFAQVDKQWFGNSPYQALNTWLQKLLAGQLFSAVMHKYVAWQPDDDMVIL